MSDGENDEHRTEPARCKPLIADFAVGSNDDLARYLEEFRPYLLAIATAEFPEAISGKLGVSDVVQDTIIKAFENYDQFQGTTREEFARWLRTILVRLLTDVYRSFRTDKRDGAREELADSQLVDFKQPNPGDVTLTRERQRHMQEALARLLPEDRETILLRHRDNLSFAEIGVRMQKSKDAARTAWIRAVQQLKQELQRDDSKHT